MINTQFEAYKIKRELKRSGIDYEFKRSGVNDFGEPVGEPTVVGTIRGLYHEQNSSVQSYQNACQIHSSHIKYGDALVLNHL